jgi:hypothetical protein
MSRPFEWHACHQIDACTSNKVHDVCRNDANISIKWPSCEVQLKIIDQYKFNKKIIVYLQL